MGAAFQVQPCLAPVEPAASQDQRQNAFTSTFHSQQPLVRVSTERPVVQLQTSDFVDEPFIGDLHSTLAADQQQQAEVLEEPSTRVQASHTEMQVQDFSDEPPLPTLLGFAGREEPQRLTQSPLPTLLGRIGREETSAQTLPNRRSSEERLFLRRRRRAQTATITSSQTLAEALASDEGDEHILRPPRVILTTAEGMHSMCLVQDRETRMQYVQVGLPAGPLLPENESCAVCLEEFKTGDRVQLMANCKHVFHAACIKTLLRSQRSNWITSDFHAPCPLCRGPLVAASVSQIPRRERPRAITLNSTWFSSESSHFEETVEEGDALTSLEVDASTKIACGSASKQNRSASLRRAGTAPLEQSDNTSSLHLQRAASSHLEALGN